MNPLWAWALVSVYLLKAAFAVPTSYQWWNVAFCPITRTPAAELCAFSYWRLTWFVLNEAMSNLRAVWWFDVQTMWHMRKMLFEKHLSSSLITTNSWEEAGVSSFFFFCIPVFVFSRCSSRWNVTIIYNWFPNVIFDYFQKFFLLWQNKEFASTFTAFQIIH